MTDYPEFEESEDMLEEEEDEYEDEDGDSDEREGWSHLGYYIRRINGELVLLQTFLVEQDGDAASADIQSLYIDLETLEQAWIDEMLIQGEGLQEGKSSEFVPPEDDEDDEDADEESEEGDEDELEGDDDAEEDAPDEFDIESDDEDEAEAENNLNG